WHLRSLARKASSGSSIPPAGLGKLFCVRLLLPFVFDDNLCSRDSCHVRVLPGEYVVIIFEQLNQLLLGFGGELSSDSTAEYIVEGTIPNPAIAVLPRSMLLGESERTIRKVICSLL
ncbi:hypothetical protein Tco_0958559, partial [Tanacetum coccineum]